MSKRRRQPEPEPEPEPSSEEYEDEYEDEEEEEEDSMTDFQGSDDDDEEEEEEADQDEEGEGAANLEDRVDDLTYDVFNLVACDDHAISLPTTSNTDAARAKLNAKLKEATVRATQLLIKRVFDLPVESSELGPLATLPREEMRFPREKRIPEPKPETKWAKFAKEKGIQKKKRERMVFDEEQKEFRPRYGYKGANKTIEEHAVVEVKTGQDRFADPWAAAKDAKKARVDKNKDQQIRNLERASGIKRGKRSKSVDTYDPSRVPGIPLEVVKGGKGKASQRGKEGVRETLKLTQFSTASMGRFDEVRRGEPAKKMKGVKRSFRDNVSSSGLQNEKSSMKAQLRIVEDKISKKARHVTNSLAPYEGILPDAPSDAFKQKKGKGKATGKSTSTSGGGKKAGGKAGKGRK